MRWPRLIVALAALLAALPAAAQDGLAGTWVWSAEGRNVFVIELEDGPDGLRGTLQRPANIEMGAHDGGWAITAVTLPVVSYTLTEVRSGPEGHVLRYEGPRSGEHLIRLEAPDRALFAIDPDPAAPRLTLRRPLPAGEVATDWVAGRSYLAEVPAAASNPEMAAIFAADQADRAAGTATDWTVVAPRDRERRQRVRELLDQGLLASGEDYRLAAFVFQHGELPEDFLLAHALAMVAQAKGRSDAGWIAAASLDRYLASIGQRQIFGTQFSTGPDGASVANPGNTALLTDAMRSAVGVPPLAEQAPP